MGKRKELISLVGIIVVAVAALLANIIAGNSPALGLDLQGGASVTLEPVGEFDSAAIDVAKDIITQRVDSLGIAEPEIIRQGDTIVVNLPGVKDQEQALALVGRTGNVLLRPVLSATPNVQTVPTDSSVPTGSSVPSGDVGDTTPTTVAATTATTVAAEDGPSSPADGGHDRRPRSRSDRHDRRPRSRPGGRGDQHDRRPGGDHPWRDDGATHDRGRGSDGDGDRSRRRRRARVHARAGRCHR